MIVQYIILVLIIGISAWYIIRKIRRPFKSKNSCGEACGKCGALDKLDEVKKTGLVRNRFKGGKVKQE